MQMKAALLLALVVATAANQLRTAGRTAPDAAAEVAIEQQQNLQIHDDFAKLAETSAEVEKQVKANKELSAIQISSRTAPDQAAEVAKEMQQNIQIHDGFATQAADDEQVARQIEADKELQAVQISSNPIPSFLQSASRTAPDATAVTKLATESAEAACTVTDGSATSANYPCACGDAICMPGQKCTSATSMCETSQDD